MDIIWIQAFVLNVIKRMLGVPNAHGIHVSNVRKAFTFMEADVGIARKIEAVLKDIARAPAVRSVNLVSTKTDLDAPNANLECQAALNAPAPRIVLLANLPSSRLTQKQALANAMGRVKTCERMLSVPASATKTTGSQKTVARNAKQLSLDAKSATKQAPTR